MEKINEEKGSQVWLPFSCKTLYPHISNFDLQEFAQKFVQFVSKLLSWAGINIVASL
jgi:hypothetical protein